MKPGDRFELRIDSLAAGGDGVARLDGRAVFVALVAPGDLVRARISEVRKRYARAELEEVLEAGPGRREPACAHFGDCGGCTWMHLDDDAQAGGREAILRDALTRIAGLAELPEIERVTSPRSLAYRSRARAAYARGAVGFRARGSRRVVDVERCLVLDVETHAELDRLRRSPPPGSGEVALRGFGAHVEVGHRSYQVGPDAFFQANGSLWKRWLEVVRETCGRGELAVELFAGVGFYTIDLADAFERVIAVERSRASRDLRQNAPVEVVESSAEIWAKKHLPDLAPDLLLMNPPRSGCDEQLSAAVARSAARRIVYVSCDPPTMARDISRFGSTFGLTRLVLLDALPQTHHVETIAVLQSS